MANVGTKRYVRSEKVGKLRAVRDDHVVLTVERWEDLFPGRQTRKSWVIWKLDGKTIKRMQFAGRKRHAELDAEWAEAASCVAEQYGTETWFVDASRLGDRDTDEN